MEKFRKRELRGDNLQIEDDGIFVHDLIDLISENELVGEILKLLKIEPIQDEFIAIQGAKTLVNQIRLVNSSFVKTDLECEFEDITFFNKKDFTFNFHNFHNNEYLSQFGLDYLPAMPIYSSTRDFFSGIYNMDKYAKNLIDQNFRDILDANIELLRGRVSNKRKYRILHDLNENCFFLRGIISTSNYYPYDNNMAVVFGLLALHQEMKTSGVDYSFKLCEYNESSVRIFFESSEAINLKGVGFVKNLVEISNDEIKREALKFTGCCLIIFENSENQERELFIKPKEIKSKILSIRHNVTPQNAIPELANIQNTSIVYNEILDDILKIQKIKEPEQIKFLLRSKVENARSEDVKIYKEKLITVLDKKVDNIIQLLELFDKMNLIADQDIDVKEYLRYLMYQVLIEGRK